MQKLHWIEGWHAWNIEVAISKWTSMADCHCIDWECLEIFTVLIRESVVVLIHQILLESNSERIQNRVIVLELHRVWLLSELEHLSYVDLWLISLDHDLYQSSFLYGCKKSF